MSGPSVCAGRQAGADHRETVKGSLGNDGGLVALKGEDIVVVDGPRDVLRHPVLADDLADPLADLLPSLEAARGAPCCLGNGLEQNLGGIKEFPALAGPLLGQQPMAADHETFTGIGITGDLHQIPVVEERHLDGTGLHQGADGRASQGADPVQARWCHLLTDPCLGEHPSHPHQNHPREREPFPHRSNLRSHRGWICTIAGEHLDRYRTSLAITQQTERDLHLALPSIPGVTPPCQGARPALHPHRGEVIEHQGALPEVALRQRPLDPLLALQEPVHGAIETVPVHLGMEDLAQSAHRRGLGEAPGRGQRRGRLQDACDNHGQDLVASRRRLRIDQRLEAQLLDGCQHRADVTMGKGTDDVEGLLEAPHRGASPEQDAQSLDEGRRPLGEVGKGALLDLAVLAPSFAQEDGGG